MATQGSMICERNCLLVMAKWSDLQPACPHSPFLRLSPQLTPPRVYKEHRKIPKQRLPDTAKGKRRWARWGGHFSFCLVSALSLPLPAWSTLNGTLHTLGYRANLYTVLKDTGSYWGLPPRHRSIWSGSGRPESLLYFARAFTLTFLLSLNLFFFL